MVRLCLAPSRAWRTAERVSYESAFKRELLEFYDCVTKNRAPRTTAEEAVRDVALCQAIIAAQAGVRTPGSPAPPGAIA